MAPGITPAKMVSAKIKNVSRLSVVQTRPMASLLYRKTPKNLPIAEVLSLDLAGGEGRIYKTCWILDRAGLDCLSDRMNRLHATWHRLLACEHPSGMTFSPTTQQRNKRCKLSFPMQSQARGLCHLKLPRYGYAFSVDVDFHDFDFHNVTHGCDIVRIGNELVG